jgi:transglutaminase-like putative cysteine protease
MLLLAPLVVEPSRASDFDLRPAPPWVERVVPELSAQLPSRAGVAGILTDHQVRVDNGNVDEYFRRVRKVVSAAGVQNASELNLDFDPSYQRLVLHDVALVRGGARINQLDPSEVRVIEKEPESEDRIYDGRLTALIFLKDVRPGDVIDYAFSLEGANPLLGGRYADEYDFAAAVPTALVRHRLLWPAGRKLHVRGMDRLQPVPYLWEMRNVEAIDDEDSVPAHFNPYGTVQVSEYGSWSEVAKWAVPMYVPDLESSAAVAELARKIRTEQKTREAQIAAAIRFVQDDIRYLGIEMGRGSHEPRQPRATLAQRYGDCKDKVFLLVELLRHLGVEAHPALVNTSLRHRLDAFLPSPFLFDHVIAQVADGRRTYWIDPTIADQGGTLTTIDTPDDGRALIVRDGTTALTKIDVPRSARTVIEETFSPNGADEATLDVTEIYRGADADVMRADLSAMTRAELAKQRINLFAADHPRIRRASPPGVSDDRVRNVIVIRERYVVERPWKDGAWMYVPRAIESHLALPETLIRTMPLAIDYPLNLTQRVTFNVGRPLDPSEVIKDTPALHYERSVNERTVTYTLRTKTDAVAARDVADHIAALNAVDDDLAFEFEPSRAVLRPWLLGLAAVAALVAVATLLAMRTRRNYLPIAAVAVNSATNEKEIQGHAQHG